MEAFLRESNRIKGTEVLFFEDAEVEKFKSDSTAFAASGPLSVLYFKDYNRFVLQINDWRYPLLRRLRIISNSEANNLASRSYFMPARNGFTFNLKINNIPSAASILNFDTILANNSEFVMAGQETHPRKAEASPDDKLARKSTKDTGAKGVIAEKAYNFMHKIKAKVATMKSGTKYLTSTKRRIDMSKIKNKNFRKSAKSTFKKSFFKDHEKMTAEFMRLRRENKNMFEAKDINALAKTSDAPAHYIVKDGIEEAILKNKDMAMKGNFDILLGRTIEEKRSVLDDVKNQLNKMKERIGAENEDLKDRIRINEAHMQEKVHSLEAQDHYA